MSLYILPPSQNKSILITINNYSERYTPRVLAAQLDDVRSRFGTKCTSMLRLQEMRPSVESCLAYGCVVGRSVVDLGKRTDLAEKSDATTAEE